MSKSVTQLTATTTEASGDLLHIVDTSTGEDKKIKVSDFWSGKPFGEFYVYQNAANDTPIAVAATEYEICNGALTTTDGELNEFTHDGSGRLTYTGEETIKVMINCQITSYLNTAGTNAKARYMLYQDGAKVNKTEVAEPLAGTGSYPYHAMSFTCIITMVKDSYIEVFTANDTSTTDIMIYDMNLNAVTL